MIDLRNVHIELAIRNESAIRKHMINYLLCNRWQIIVQSVENHYF